MRPDITTIPQELSDAIALELTLLEPLGPPAVLLPLMASSRILNARLSPDTNPILHAAIFRQKFDSAAVARRHGGVRPTAWACVAQLHRYLAALRVFRRGDVHEGVCDGLWGDDVSDIGLEEALQIGVVMMMEDDGKNARQMLLWARADIFVKRLLTRRLYASAETQDGWPSDDEVNAHALWLLWLLTSEESLLRETPEERESITRLLTPFIYAPFRYTPFYAPPDHFLIPPPTLPTPPGPYSLSPPPSTILCVHYGTRRAMGRPPAALAAILAFHARVEVHARPIPPHLVHTRPDLPEHLDPGVAPTREDVEELRWAWVARPPLGAGLTGRDGKRVLVDGWQRREYSPADNANDDTHAFPERPKDQTQTPHMPVERWVGKAPHSPHPWAGKSVRWDADWVRLRMCSDMWAPRRRGTGPGGSVGYVHTPGSLDGLWTGVMQMQLLPEGMVQQLASEAGPSVFGSAAEAVAGASQPVSVVLTEVQRAGRGGGCCCGAAAADVWLDEELDEYDDDDDEGTVVTHNDDDDNDDQQQEEQREPEETRDDYFALACAAAGVTNAWFAGEGPPVFAPLPPQTPSSTPHQVHSSCLSKTYLYQSKYASASDSLHPDTTDATQYQVRAAGGTVSGTFHTHAHSHQERAYARGERLGNDAACPEHEHDANSGPGAQVAAHADASSSPSPHHACPRQEQGSAQPARKASDERIRESLFASLGLPSDAPTKHTCATQTQDILLHGSTPAAPARAWHPFTYHGRIRPWDGLVALVRAPRRAKDEYLGRAVFCGYVVGGEVLVGAWRMAGSARGPQVVPFGVGGVFCWSRRGD
ncbi:hypothetical protein H0H81_008679 [Sphagnurus paluster]|uniref:Uncharacterized protein n=1 Tax=Sphagnurus paluster TaxID=117069 RepID=A0A9P7K7I2_9AGAR|nr:hypothetical protein H0H81_008679 [Sphagnurus paluster]